ncbi:hypothetical protein MXB_936, partial [Myxobolus squamalis]
MIKILCFFEILWNIYSESSLFNTNNYVKISLETDMESLFGYNFHVFKNANTNTSQVLIGAPKTICKYNSQRCGAIYNCDISSNLTHSNCSIIDTIYNEFGENLFENDMIGYHVENYKSWGIMICAPLKNILYNNTLKLKGWCGKLDSNLNVTSFQFGAINDIIGSKKELNSLGFSSVYLEKLSIIVVSDPISFRGRDLNLNKIEVNNVGYIQYGYSGMAMRTIELDDDSSKTYLLYSGEGKSGKTLFLMEIRKESVNFPHPTPKFLIQITELENLIDPLHALYSQVGFDFLSLDINGDGWEDILVSLPYYNDSRGIVSQLIAKRENNKFSKFLSAKILIGDDQENCLFGYSFTFVGDLNEDGIQDIAISAPFCSKDTGGGCVYIYLSRRNLEFSDPYFQKICESSFQNSLYSFGMRIKSGFEGSIIPKLGISDFIIDRSCNFCSIKQYNNYFN